jgi:CMP-N,N'-diacetyllegionaminic acid synthase
LNIAAIIPARAGSKGLPGKNMRLFAGKPLVQHAIEAAQASGRFQRIYVTSNDSAVLDLAEGLGALPLRRPEHLARDQATMADVVRDVGETLLASGGESSEAFALLQPTTPLRTAKDIGRCVDEFAVGLWASAVSVCPLDEPPQKALFLKDGLLEPLFGWDALQSNRQSLAPTYRQNGAIWVVRWKEFCEFGRFVVAPAMPFVMDQESSIDIDTIGDFEAAEMRFLARRTTAS